jgi:hypothetical protein
MRQSRAQALGAGILLLGIGAGVALWAAPYRDRRRRRRLLFDYSDRSGFPRPPSEMRGAARRPTGARSSTEASAVQPAALRHS